MADLLYSWADLEGNIEDGKIGYFHGKATRFNEHKDRYPEYIWLVRQDRGSLWLLGKLSITETAPKSFPKNHDPDFIFYDPTKSVFFDDVALVSKDAEDLLSKATRGMKKNNFQGVGAEGLLELADQKKLEAITNQAATISFDEFKVLLKSGSLPTPPFRLGSRVPNKPSTATVANPVVEAPSNNTAPVAAGTLVAVSDITQTSTDASPDDRGKDWVVSEIDLIVSEYFAMLAIEAKQGELNKAARCSQLITKLNGRSKGSIEFKLQNISAVLLDLGQPHIRGYKPLGNYQKLLRERTTEFMIGNRELIEGIFQNYGSSLPDGATEVLTKVDPPIVGTGNADGGGRQRFPRKLDFPALDEQNRALGLKGEEWVIGYERQRLRDSGLPNLADQIEWTSQEKGDGTGYDIQSFNEDGSTRYIEVKTTNAGASTPFYVSQNEVDFSAEVGDRFFIYRVFDFSSEPKFYELRGSLKVTARLEATAYRARPLSKAELPAD